ncbi:MAG: hypothetical protein QM627_04775 [Luteolibacter sp.]
MKNAWLLLSILLVLSGCRSEPAGSAVLNVGRARNIFVLISDYSDAHGKMPPHLYVLHTITPNRPSSESFTCLSHDKKAKADFLYFASSLKLDQLPSEAIVLASPFPATSKQGRYVLRASGRSEFLSENEFHQAMVKRILRENP